MNAFRSAQRAYDNQTPPESVDCPFDSTPPAEFAELAADFVLGNDFFLDEMRQWYWAKQQAEVSL
jgi:hypothetical protein